MKGGLTVLTIKLLDYKKLLKDMKEIAKTCNDEQARYMVDLYYSIQKVRVALGNRVHALEEDNEPFDLLAAMHSGLVELEDLIQSTLKAYTKRHPMGLWLLSITGIGPVLSAGLVANIDIEKLQSAGQLWSFAGLNPDAVWEKGKVRPWNARLKVLCWKIGESFMMQSFRPNCYYGHLYLQRKEYEIKNNSTGKLADYAKYMLKTKPGIKKHTKTYAAYSKGELPDSQIIARAKRWTVKIFLSHFFAHWYEWETGKKAPIPYVIQHMGHCHEITPPPMVVNPKTIIYTEEEKAVRRLKKAERKEVLRQRMEKAQIKRQKQLEEAGLA